MKKKQKNNKRAVIIESNRVLRQVDAINESQKIIEILEEKGLLGSNIVKTKVLSSSENMLEHEKISPIIHSGEYTASMAYDVTKIAIDMAIDLIDKGIYSYDLMPHNFTFINGKWILYDFGSFELTPNNIKTQSRSLFKISFSSFELLKIIDRKYLKHYFLNRISHLPLLKMINFNRWLYWVINLFLCLFLCRTKQYKKSYLHLKKVYNEYESKHLRKTYNLSLTESENQIFNLIDEKLNGETIENIFCVGEKSAKWALATKIKTSKFVYIEDYDKCDEYYNFIVKNKYMEISTGVVYPFTQDNSIDTCLNYRGLYDYFAQERFISDVAIILDITEFNKNKAFSTETFCSNMSNFAKKSLILGLPQFTKEDIDACRSVLQKYFHKIDTLSDEQNIILICSNKVTTADNNRSKTKYGNENRGKEAKTQSLKIIEILKKH